MKSRGEGLVLPRHLLVRFLLGHGLGAIRRLGCGTPVSDLSQLLDRHKQEAKALALAEKGGTLLRGNESTKRGALPAGPLWPAPARFRGSGLGSGGPQRGARALSWGRNCLGFTQTCTRVSFPEDRPPIEGGRSHVSESGSNLSTPPRLSARGPVERCPGSRASGLRLPVSSAIKSVCDLRTYMRAGRLSRSTGRVDGALSFRAESALGGRSARELWVGTKVF